MATNISFCGSVGANTGAIDCDTTRGNPLKPIIGSGAYPIANLTSASFKVALIASLKLATGDSGKMYPFPEIVGSANNTEANKEATLGNGAKRTISEGRPAYTFDVEIGTNLEKQLRKFNGQKVPVMIFDDNKNVWGKINSDDEFVGIDAEIFVKATPFGNFSDARIAQITVSFLSAADFSDYAAFVSTDFNVNDLEGLLDAEVVRLAAPTGNAHKMGAVIRNASIGNDVNLYTLYADPLAVVGAWTGKTAAGATVAPTTVAKDTSLLGWTVTFGVAVASINLTAPSVLDGLDVTGIEGMAYTI